MPTDATRAKELAGLIERVEKATYADREIDEAVGLLAGWTWKKTHGSFGYWACPDAFDFYGFEGDLPHFTEDLNAALALVERMLPGATFSLDRVTAESPPKPKIVFPIWTCEFHWFINPAWHVRADKQTAPLAILLALLKALSQESQDAQ